MTDPIETTGNLRKFLAQTILQVREGTIGLEEAARICKLAAQINEGFYSELKAQKVASELGTEAKPLGELPIG
jgi:hypothetical protein